MQSELPFYDNVSIALTAAVAALGGAKKVGHKLWPHKDADSAATSLLNCINSDRKEKLEITELMWIFSQAREEGCHSPFVWFSAQIGYDAKPISKNEKIDRLTSVIDGATKTMALAISQLEQLRGGHHQKEKTTK